jgi:hypothetical protein
MPIFAALLVNETSVNTGAAEGNDPPTATVLAIPLTEIVACVTFVARGFAAVNRLDGPLPELGFWDDAGFVDVAFLVEGQPAAAQSEIC